MDPRRHSKLVDFTNTPAPPGLFALSTDLGLQIPRDWAGLMALPGLSRIKEAEEAGESLVCNALEWARDRIDSQALDTTRARFIVDEWAVDKWALVTDEEDGALGGWNEEKGENARYDIVGTRLNMSHLSRDQQVLLLFLISARMPRGGFEEELTKAYNSPRVYEPLGMAEEALLEAFFSLCPREVRLPPIDLDAEKAASGFNPEDAGRIAIGYAKQIDDAIAERPEFGKPRYYVASRESRSMHVDFCAPEGVASAHLPEAWGALVVPMLIRLGIPANTVDLKGVDKADRPMIFADSSLFQKYPTSRNGVWRPPGASKPKKNSPKLLVPNLDQPDVLVLEPQQPREWDGRTIDPDFLRAAIELVASSPDAIRRQESTEKALRNVLAGVDPNGGRANIDPKRLDVAMAARNGRKSTAPNRRSAKPAETSGPELTPDQAATELAKLLRRLPYGEVVSRAAATCMLCKFPAPIVAAALVEANRIQQPAAEAWMTRIRFPDSGTAWTFVTSTLGEDPAYGLIDDMSTMRLVRKGSISIPPAWSIALLHAVSSGLKPLTEKDIPDETLRRYVESEPSLSAAWFRVTGNRSEDENQFARACHGTDVSFSEALYLCLLKPGSKSSVDPRGADYAENNVLRNVEKKFGPFGPGVSNLEESTDLAAAPKPPEAAAARKKAKEEERARRRAERAVYKTDRRRRGEEWFQKHDRTIVHSFGEAALPAVAEVLKAQRTALFECSEAVRLASGVAESVYEATYAIATWLLAEGLPEPAVMATLGSSICHASFAARVVADATRSIGNHETRGERWIQELMPQVHAALAPVVDTELLERGAEARVKFQEARDAAITVTHLKQAAEVLGDHQCDDEDPTPPSTPAGCGQDHEHGQACAEAPSGGLPEPPPTPPKESGSNVFRKTARRLTRMFGGAAAAVGPKAAAAVLSFLVGLGMPGRAAADTFREAGLPEADHVWDVMRDSGRKHPEALRGAVVKEVGERGLSRLVAALERDLTCDDGSLDATLKGRLYQNFVGRWALLAEERDYMLALSKVAAKRQVSVRAGVSAQERAAEAALAKRINRVSRGLYYASKCGLFRQYLTCPDHGERGSRLLVTDREIACRHCAYRWARSYRDWISQNWPEKVNMVRVDVPQWSPGPGKNAPYDERDRWRTTLEHMREVSVQATKVKAARWGEVYDKVTAGDHAQPPQALPDGSPPTPAEGEDEEGGSWGDWVVGSRGERINVMDNRPCRWIYGRDHFVLFTPCEIVEKVERSDGTFSENRKRFGPYVDNFANHHRKLGRKVTQPKPLIGHPLHHAEQRDWQYAVSRDDAARAVYDALLSLNEQFDDMLKDRDPFLVYYEWLTPGLKRTTANGGGKKDLPWPDRDEIRAFMAEANKDATEPEKPEDEVEPGHCDQDVPDETDPERRRTRKCGRACRVTVAHEPTQTVVAQNSSGVLYSVDDVLERAAELGLPETLPLDDLE